VDTIFLSFLNAAVSPAKFPIKESTFLATLGFDESTYVLCGKFLSDVLGELFPDVSHSCVLCCVCLKNKKVETGTPKTVYEIKALMLASLVRARDRQDKTRPCAQCGKLPEFSSRCSRCKSVV
jgi:hypothetical protein